MNTDERIVREIRERRARRAYDERPVEQDVLERVMTAATLAPSCGNNQSWRYLVCDEGSSLDKMRQSLSKGNYWARKAPVLIMVLTRDDLDCMLSDDRRYAQFDTGMATMNLMLQATAEGLYAHPMAGYDTQAFRELFGIEPETRLLAMIALGYPGDASHLSEKHAQSEVDERERMPLSDVVLWNTWRDVSPNP